MLNFWRRRAQTAGSRARPLRQTERPVSHGGKVSVVIPLYNHGRYISEAVESALAQGEIVRDVIIVDDGSRDDSVAVISSLADADARITSWSQPNRGAHAAINAGLMRATGDLLAILNSDD